MSEKSKEIDHCGNCTVKGDLKKCLEAPCQIHDTWAFRELLQKTQQLEKELAELKEFKDTVKRFILLNLAGFMSEYEVITAINELVTLPKPTADKSHHLKHLTESQKLPDFEMSKILNDNFHDLVGEGPTAEAGE